jgi:alpha-L-rhamnosidase
MRLTITLLMAFVITTAIAQKISLYDLTVEHKTDPIGITNSNPRMSWKLRADGKNVMQTAYQVRVAISQDFSKNSIAWESGKVNGDATVLVPYAGSPLKSRTKYYWQVKVWDNKKRESGWSTASWETGFMSNDEWKAKWIEPVQDTARRIPALMVRKDFSVAKKISSARAYVTSHGFYELSINGKKVGDQVLTPGWTSYQARLQYQVYDITNHLQQGQNAIGAMLGDGWYRGTLGWIDGYGIWGKTLGLLCELHIRYSDGSEDVIITDKSWKGSSNGPIVLNGIYDGETYDARKEIDGWNKPGFNAQGWKDVNEAHHDNKVLIAMETVPVQRIQELKPVKIFRTPKGTLVADLGQNMVGWIRLKVKGNAGTEVTIRHAEVLDKFGEFYTANLRAAAATMKYILKGTGSEEVYEPRFTFFGFRYISIDGFPGELKPENITGIVVHSNMEPTGTFECSNQLVNQLQKNIVWGQKGNFVDVPTDCPQRDERLGWTGDAQAFCRTAAFNMNVAPFFTKWLKDLKSDQRPDGKVPFVIPDVLKKVNATSAGWGDVATIAPWTMYQVFGDKQFLENQYTSMKAYVDYIQKTAGDSYIWKGGSVFGDWLYFKPRMEEHTVPDGHTSPDMIATMFYAYSAGLVAKTARELGKNDEAVHYEGLFKKVKDTFSREYVTPSGRISSDSQTAYVLALMFDLLSPEMKKKATEYLVADIKARGNHLSTGFLGTPYLCHVLSDNGQLSVAYDLLLQESFPSWLFPVKMGATTIWERWDGQKPDSTFQDVGMNSFNHYAYGAIGDWMYRVVAGIEIGKPGYKHILIQPKPDSRLTYAKATYNSNYGDIASGWELRDGKLTVTVTIPANTTATITLPDAKIENVTSNSGTLSSSQDFRNAKEENGNAVFDVGSGTYTFTYALKSNS